MRFLLTIIIITAAIFFAFFLYERFEKQKVVKLNFLVRDGFVGFFTVSSDVRNIDKNRLQNDIVIKGRETNVSGYVPFDKWHEISAKYESGVEIPTMIDERNTNTKGLIELSSTSEGIRFFLIGSPEQKKEFYRFFDSRNLSGVHLQELNKSIGVSD